MTILTLSAFLTRMKDSLSSLSMALLDTTQQHDDTRCMYITLSSNNSVHNSIHPKSSWSIMLHPIQERPIYMGSYWKITRLLRKEGSRREACIDCCGVLEPTVKTEADPFELLPRTTTTATVIRLGKDDLRFKRRHLQHRKHRATSIFKWNPTPKRRSTSSISPNEMFADPMAQLHCRLSANGWPHCTTD